MGKNDKYLIAIDLDGTLIKDGTKYDEETFKYLKELNKQHKVVLATGRPYRSSKLYYDLLELDTPIINYNGSLIHHPLDKRFPTETLFIDKEALISFIGDLGDDFVNVFCEIHDDIFLWEDNESIRPYLHYRDGNLAIGKFQEILPANPHGAILFTKQTNSERLLELAKTKYQKYFNIRIWYYHSEVVSEIYHPETSKAYGLDYICKYYNIGPKKVIAIGDNHNDLEMIRFASIGAAMANGNPVLLQEADTIIPSIDNQGVLKFLQTYFKAN